MMECRRHKPRSSNVDIRQIWGTFRDATTSGRTFIHLNENWCIWLEPPSCSAADVLEFNGCGQAWSRTLSTFRYQEGKPRSAAKIAFWNRHGAERLLRLVARGGYGINNRPQMAWNQLFEKTPYSLPSQPCVMDTIGLASFVYEGVLRCSSTTYAFNRLKQGK
ncbi:uncharacterized protein BCR38DRAFT_239182 [Pseudomassariella vexata]|uniref:Uncharacterized protein n=1 Tax=Pseudomassariella vexata TaxID=1141098 RepID=A0A1Y2DT04_9PEZI|nr:uncharacterized protein BCR38DRAFT_239182 [Pseudomassariella vexata]ORY62401.1 hypothetical protein BCR38DRAFT_239182 [Pseudomassariella vexata]